MLLIWGNSEMGLRARKVLPSRNPMERCTVGNGRESRAVDRGKKVRNERGYDCKAIKQRGRSKYRLCSIPKVAATKKAALARWSVISHFIQSAGFVHCRADNDWAAAQKT